MDVIGVIERETNNIGLAQILHSLDEKSRAILGYLWWHRHAEIAELRNSGGTADDSEIIYRLKEVINSKSQSLWGKPIVSFEQSKIDPLTGEKILFSWWYMDEAGELASGVDRALVDVFNEKDNVTIIAQLPASVDISAPEIQFKNDILRVKFKKIGIEQNN